jgi:hypothetical protein
MNPHKPSKLMKLPTPNVWPSSATWLRTSLVRLLQVRCVPPTQREPAEDFVLTR